MDLLMMTGFPTAATPPWNIATLAITNGSVQRAVPEMAIMMTMMTKNSSTPRRT